MPIHRDITAEIPHRSASIAAQKRAWQEETQR